MDDRSDQKKLIEQMNEYYRRRAPWHDYYMSYKSHDATEKLMTPLIEIIHPLISGKDILEIACGTGIWTQVLSRRARSVTATDINEAVIELARKKQYDNDNVTFQIADAYSADKLQNKFDVVFASDWFSHIPLPMISRFQKSINNCLHDNGVVIMIDMMYRKVFEEEKTINDAYHNRISNRQVPDAGNFNVVKNFFTEETIKRHLKDFAGDIQYIENLELKRWMVIYRKP